MFYQINTMCFQFLKICLCKFIYIEVHIWSAANTAKTKQNCITSLNITHIKAMASYPQTGEEHLIIPFSLSLATLPFSHLPYLLS